MDSVFNEICLPDQQQTINDSNLLPLVLVPTSSQVTLNETCDYVHQFKESILEKLLKSGAILFRQFPIHTADDFNQFALSFEWKELPYIGKQGAFFVLLNNHTNSISLSLNVYIYVRWCSCPK